MSGVRADLYVVDSQRSLIKIRTKSKVHDINGTGSGITGEMSAAFRDGALDRDASVSMNISIPVSKLTSGNHAQDERMHALVGSRAHPNIEAHLTHAVPGNDPQLYRISGSVSVRGTNRLFGGEVTISERNGRVEISGSREFDIRMWRIEPPSFLGFGVEPMVFVELRLFADRTTA